MARPHMTHPFIHRWTPELPPPLGTMNNAAVNTGVQVLFKLLLLSIHLEVELLDHMISL